MVLLLEGRALGVYKDVNTVDCLCYSSTPKPIQQDVSGASLLLKDKN